MSSTLSCMCFEALITFKFMYSILFVLPSSSTFFYRALFTVNTGLNWCSCLSFLFFWSDFQNIVTILWREYRRGLDLLNTYRSWQQITIALSLIQTMQFTTARSKSAQSLPGDGSQQYPLLPCLCSYRLATVPQITHSSRCLTPRLAAI
jgi:hypothetical protein